MRLVDVQLGRYDWAGMECGCGESAVHLPGLVRRLLAAGSRAEADAAGVGHHAMVQSFPQEPAVPLASVFMAALVGDLSAGARATVLQILLNLVLNDDDDSSDECQDIAREGLWVLYGDLLALHSGDVSWYAYKVLEVVDRDEGRLADYLEAVKPLLPADLF